MSRRLPISVYKRINTQSFKSNPYIFNKNLNDKCKFPNDIENNTTSQALGSITTHPSVKLHPALKYSLVTNNLLTKLNEIQESSYLSIVSGKDVTIHSPAGTGKTIAYLLPILNNVYYIHDMLEKLMFKNDTPGSKYDDELRNLSMAWNKRLGHSLLPSNIVNYRQDVDELKSLGSKMFEKYKDGTTLDKLLDVLHLHEPRCMKMLGLPTVPMKIWKKRSKNSIYRNIMSNPLGSVRCVVILVPNKDLVSHVISYINKIDILGRVSVQSLSSICLSPTSNTSETNGQIDKRENVENSEPGNDKTGIGTEGLDSNIDREIQNIFYEDQLKMIENVPVKQVEETEVETMPINMPNRVKKIKTKTEINYYSIDGLVPDTISYRKQPLITSDNIQWGCVDIVVSTVQNFVFEVLSFTRRGIYPICVVFDEVDMLFENNATRSSVFEIISKLRPRPRTYNPLVDVQKRTSKAPPPVQIINVASTINFGGLQTCGSMIFERFNTSKLVFSDQNHVISSDLEFEKTDSNQKLDCLVKLIVNNPVKKTLIYCNSLKNCKLIYDTLRKHDWPVLSFHRKSALATRLAILKTFEDDEPRILVGTDLVTRGINVSGDHIINYDFPTSSSTFFHRIKVSKAKVTSIMTEDSELSDQITHFTRNRKPISQILSRKRSLRKSLDRIKFEKISSKVQSHRKMGDKGGDRGFFNSRLVIEKEVPGDSKYRRIPLKKRLISILNNFN
uniref:DEAD-family helicase, putative n=1 Tax=Theileria annulata TaxID=5874 RepID=A0A3B0NJG5_THEAN